MLAFMPVPQALPRVALLAASGMLTANVRVLTWGLQPYEYDYLSLLGVQASQVLPYNASQVYCAGTDARRHDTCTQLRGQQQPEAPHQLHCSPLHCTAERLLVPTPTPRITPPREGLQLVRQGLGVQTLPAVSGSECRWLGQAGLGVHPLAAFAEQHFPASASPRLPPYRRLSATCSCT